MLNRRNVRSLIALAGLAGGWQIAAPAAHAQAVPVAGPAVTDASVGATIDRAAALSAEGKVVAARELLLPLARGDESAMTDADRERLFRMLTNLKRRIDALSPVEASLQSAEAALVRDDLVLADKHARSVSSAPRATNEQASSAKDILARVAARQQELAERAPAVLDRAVESFEAGKIDQARADLDQLVRWGVPLNDEQARALDAYSRAVVEAQGGLTGPASGSSASAGMMQPGVVQRDASSPAAGAPETVVVTTVAQGSAAGGSAGGGSVPPEPVPATPVLIGGEPAPAGTEAAAEAAPAPSSDPVTQVRDFEAQQLLNEADQAFDQGRFTTASDRYARLLASYSGQLSAEQSQHAQTRLSESNRMLAGALGGQPLQEYVDRTRLIQQRATAEFDNALAQAQAALETGDTNRARELTAGAKLIVSGAREVFSQTQIEEFEARANTLLDEINRASADQVRRNLEEQQRQVEAETARAADQARQEKSRKINEAIDRCRALQSEQKYEEALQVVDQILFLDPLNPTGLLLREVYSDILVYQRHTRIEKARHRSYADLSNENNAAMIAPDGIMDFPEDWPRISMQRGTPVAFSESEENRRILAQLESKRVPVTFNETPLEAALAYVQAVTNIQMDVDWESLRDVGIEKETPLSLTLNNVRVRTLLDRVTEKVSDDETNAAAWAVQDGMLVVASRAVINRNRTLVIYDIRDLLIDIPDYDNAPDFDLQSVTQQSGAGGGGGGQSPFSGGDDDDDTPRRTLEERTQDLIEIITTNVDPLGWIEAAGEVGAIQQLQGSLIITNTPANHRAIEGLLSKLREVRAMQINVESRLLLVSQDFFEQIGFDIDVYFNGNNNQVRAARAINPAVTPDNFFNFERGGYQDGFFTPSGSSTRTFSARPSPLSVVGAPQNSLGLTESLQNSTFGAEILQQAPALGVAGQFLDDIQVDFLVKATQADRRNVSLTAPRLTFTNGQRANISVSTQQSYVAGLTPVVSEGAVGFDPQIAVLSEGVGLDIEGTISADRRYVTMNVQVSVSRLEDFRQSAVTAVAGGGLINSADTSSFVQLPIVTVTQVNTTVTAPDQGTVLLGGQRIVTNVEVETGVPVLSKIPIINRFFSNRIETREEQSLMILIKPTILIQNEQEENNFPGLGESIRLPFGG